ncbi:hypothetical protein HZH68_015098 [Vespula germanica]|uniref:Uncharacterized protein n=1 Tax=Vespula germanica TaxID=30212 RepID=A0A834JA68_VESGE|nr:hypothetical protein HZH68_015098 [Vespula germanica]
MVPRDGAGDGTDKRVTNTYIARYGRECAHIYGNVEQASSAIAQRLIWYNGEFIWVDSPPFNQQDCLRPPTDTATDYRVGPHCASPRKIIPVETTLLSSDELAAAGWRAFETTGTVITTG